MLLTSLGFETKSCSQVDNFLSDFQTYNLSSIGRGVTEHLEPVALDT